MGIAAGELRHRVTVQTLQTGGRDEDGFEIDPVWVDYVQIWAKISPLSSRDVITAQASGAEVVARMVVRHRTDLNTEMRVIFRGEIYHIVSDGLHDNQNGLIYTTYQLSKGVERSRGK